MVDFEGTEKLFPIWEMTHIQNRKDELRVAAYNKLQYAYDDNAAPSAFRDIEVQLSGFKYHESDAGGVAECVVEMYASFNKSINETTIGIGDVDLEDKGNEYSTWLNWIKETCPISMCVLKDYEFTLRFSGREKDSGDPDDPFGNTYVTIKYKDGKWFNGTLEVFPDTQYSIGGGDGSEFFYKFYVKPATKLP